MSLRLKICRDRWGSWSVHGLSAVPVSHLPSLSASIEHAREACDAAPATIELVVDGMYIVIYQERGWPRQLVAPQADLTCSAPAGPAPSKAANRSRPFAWLRGLWNWSAEGSLAVARKEDTRTAASLRLG